MTPEELTEDVLERLAIRTGGWSTPTTPSVTHKLVLSIVEVVMEAFQARLNPYIEALQLLGNHIANAPESEKPSVWDCYCGTRNVTGRACIACDRRRAEGNTITPEIVVMDCEQRRMDPRIHS